MFVEPLYAFPDLYNFGFIGEKHQFTAYTATGMYTFRSGEPFPAARIGRGGIVLTGNSQGAVFYAFIYRGSNFVNDNSYASLLALGSFSTGEALAIDLKP